MVRPVGDTPVDAMVRFANAEARLYPMAITDPAADQVAISRFGLVAHELRRSCADISTVLE